MSFSTKNNVKTTQNLSIIHPVSLPDVKIIMHGCLRIEYDWRFDKKAPFWFLYYNSSSGAKIDFGDRILSLTPRDVLLIPPHTLFHSSCEQPFEHLYIHFTTGHPYSTVLPGPILLSRERCPPLEILLQNPSPPPTALYAFVYYALALIPQNRFSTTAHLQDERIQRALNMLENGMGNYEISRAIGMSISNFQRLFKLEIGVSPKHYAMQLRLEHARCKLLEGKSIVQMAEECGFADRYAFSKAFKAYFHISPTQCTHPLGKPKSRLIASLNH